MNNLVLFSQGFALKPRVYRICFSRRVIYCLLNSYLLHNENIERCKKVLAECKISLPLTVNSYINVSQTAGMEIVMPYVHCFLDTTLDYNRIRSGENKYLVREVFRRLYPQFCVPPKVPMPRPMTEWFSNWKGPKREEFYPHCTDGMSGDQEWLVWSLERFLEMIENE